MDWETKFNPQVGYLINDNFITRLLFQFSWVINFIVFTLAIFVGYFVVWAVTPALHTPLMSVTNAISGIIIVGSLTLIVLSPENKSFQSFLDISSFMGYFATVLASINVFGGFVVTQRMLAMYKKKNKND